MCDSKWRGDVIVSMRKHGHLIDIGYSIVYLISFSHLILKLTMQGLYCFVHCGGKKKKKAKTWANKSQIMSQDLKSRSSGSKTYIFPIP